MNVVVLMGRLVRDVEVRYTQGAQPIAIGRYTLAVDRAYKRDGESEADFINIVTFGKRAEFAEKYFRKGQRVAVEGELRINSYTDKDGNKKWSTDVVVNKQHFADSKQQEGGSAFPPAPQVSRQTSAQQQPMPPEQGYGSPQPQYRQEALAPQDFVPIDDEFPGDENLPF